MQTDKILIDPILLTIPSEFATKEEVETWLSNLEKWLEKAVNSLHNWFYPFSAVVKLSEENFYPSAFRLFHWQRRFDIDIDIEKILDRLNLFLNGEFDNEFRLENLDSKYNQLGIDLLVDQMVVLPEEFVNRWPSPSVKTEMLDLLAKGCLAEYAETEFSRNFKIATIKLSARVQEINVKVVSLLTKPSALPGQTELEKIYPLLFTPQDLSNHTQIPNVEELWKRRDFFFPSLLFCDAVKENLEVLLKRYPFMVRPVFTRLSELEQVSKDWYEHNKLNFENLNGEPRGESSSTKAMYGANRQFKCPDGKIRLFAQHVSLTPQAWRIHFFPFAEQRKIIVGYIGPHLPTQSDPT